MLKEDDEYVHDDVEVGIAITNGEGVINISHAIEDMETSCDNVISKDEILLIVCASNRKMYGFIIKGIKSIDDMTPHNDEELDLFGPNVKQNVTDQSGSSMISTKEDGSSRNTENFDPISYLGGIRLIPRLPGILKFKLHQMNMESDFINRYLNLEFKSFPFDKAN